MSSAVAITQAMSAPPQPSQAKLVVLITGATGYVGGSVLYRLLNLPDAQSKYELRTVVRNAEKAEKLREFGVKTIIGSHSDVDLMARESKEADVILTAGDCDDLNVVEGITKGMKKHFEATGTRPILIHSSGAGVISDPALGEYTSDTIFDDTNLAQLESIPHDAPHRPVELKIINADEEGYAKTYIVAAGIIYGVARHPLVVPGISNPRSLFFRLLVPTAIKRGNGIAIGKGENTWLIVSIDEGELRFQDEIIGNQPKDLLVADFYELLFKSVLDQSRLKEVPHGKEGYFFLGAEEIKTYRYHNDVSRILFDLGKAESAQPTQFTLEEAEKYFGPQEST
ncbi:hypothetical protein AAF712_009229 [Marasmius tenuissimus]|uniref:NAD(P)-binding domain-containing protein n=1 Tax=Marasmius tenuissimus TaxID=585030 RepID=A0ABR2ZRI9_9AGAR